MILIVYCNFLDAQNVYSWGYLRDVTGFLRAAQKKVWTGEMPGKRWRRQREGWEGWEPIG